MRAFRFAFFIYALLCTTGAMADANTRACWEIKNKCSDKNSCIVSGRLDDTFYFKCGSNDCGKGAMIGIKPDMQTEYYECDGTKWQPISETNLNKKALTIRDCGIDQNASNQVEYVVYKGAEYDFYSEQHTKWSVKSDICKKPKTEKVEKPKEATKPIEQPVVKDTPAPVSVSKKNNITISGTVVDENDEPLPFVNIAEVGSINSGFLNGTTSDTDGKFQLSKLNPDDQIQFSSIGFETNTITVSALQPNANIVMKSSTANLNEVTISPCDTENGEKFEPETGKCIKEEPKSVNTKTDKEDDTPTVLTPVLQTPATNSEELSEKLKSARDALAAAKEKENSWVNRGLTAASTAVTGLGAMQLAEGIAERKADNEAESEMRNYISTIKCEYGGGQGAVFGNEEITLPGGNELLEYYTEYKTLADNLKTTKAALGLSAGIESEVLYNRAQSGLYQYANTGKTGGGETSLYRALTDAESTDATAWSEQKETASKKLKAGVGVTAVGVGGGILGNYLINGRDKKDEEK